MAVLGVWFTLYVFDIYIDVFDVYIDVFNGRHNCRGNMLEQGKKCHKSIELHFSVLSCYFTKREDNAEKRIILKLTLNFGGDSSDTTSIFLKMASADGYFLYEDDFDAVTTITDC